MWKENNTWRHQIGVATNRCESRVLAKSFWVADLIEAPRIAIWIGKVPVWKYPKISSRSWVSLVHHWCRGSWSSRLSSYGTNQQWPTLVQSTDVAFVCCLMIACISLTNYVCTRQWFEKWELREEMNSHEHWRLWCKNTFKSKLKHGGRPNVWVFAMRKFVPR